MNQIIIGFTTEGSTDKRLLESIIQRTFEAIALECRKQIEVNPIITIDKEHADDFIGQIKRCAKKAFENGIMALCVHVDADTNTDEKAFDEKINPSFDSIIEADEFHCKNLIAVVPIQMSESWMLADKELLKEEIGTEKSDADLGINRAPESIADPKTAIEHAIRIARQDMVKRRRSQLKIAELYQPIGQKIDLDRLDQISSYVKFKESVRQAYRYLNYLQ